MANIKIPRKQFEKEIGKLTDEMQNKIAMFGTTVENITEDEVEIEIFPNRPDLLSYQGFKRSFMTFLGKQKGIKKYSVHKPEKNYKVRIEPSVKKIRPYTACAIIKGLKLNDEKIKEIIDIQEKLHNTLGRKRKKAAIGIYPLEKIKLPITYKALEPDKIKFVPLEMDKEISGLQILQRHPAGQEYAHLLAGKPKFPIFIDAAKNILSMPPVINSHLTGKITASTTDVFIECSGFDFNILKKCLNILVTTFADMGGEIYQMILHGAKAREITPDLTSEKMNLNVQNANKLLGIELNEKQVKHLLEKMGHEYQKNSVRIPAWRTDVLHEVDLIEDIAIAYGYENFAPEIPEISTIGEEDFKETIKRKISEIMTGKGLLEISNYHLTNKKDQFKKMKLKEQNFIEVEESKTDYTILRENLAHYILKIFSENVDTEYPQKVFEIGKVFKLENNNIKETEHLTVAITPGNFTELKQILDYLSRMINIKLKLEEPDAKEIPSYFIEGRCGEIVLEDASAPSGGRAGHSLGFIGEIHPQILKNWKLKMPVALFEINLEKIFEELV